MIKNLLLFTFIMAFSFINAQCVPNTDYTGLLGVSEEAYDGPDETTILPHAIVGQSYETFFYMRIPADTAITYDLGNGPTDFDPVFIDTISVNSIAGLPMGFSYDCVSQDENGDLTPNNCSFVGGGYGCLQLSSSEVPNVVGTYPITVVLDIVAEYSLFGVGVPVEVTDSTFLNYLVLIVEEENNSSVSEIIDARSFNIFGAYPNPAEDFFSLKFGNDKSSPVEFNIYDVRGTLMYSDNINSNIGYNEIKFDTSKLVSGIYTYTLSNQNKLITNKLIIK